MSSFVWYPFGTVQQLSGGPQTFTVGSTFTGIVLGGGGLYSRGAIVSPDGGFILGGVADAQRFNVFFNYKYNGTGGIILGGVAQMPTRFSPDPDFPGELVTTWQDDTDFPGEALGGD